MAIPQDWEKCCGYQSLLLETLVGPARFRGTWNRAAKWILLDQTQGRGRMHHADQAAGRAVEDISTLAACAISVTGWGGMLI